MMGGKATYYETGSFFTNPDLLEDSVHYRYMGDPGFRSRIHSDAFKVQRMQEHIGWKMLSIKETRTVLEQMSEVPSVKDFICVLQKCRKMKDLTCAMHVHFHIRSNGFEVYEVLVNHLIPLLVECGSMPDAQRVFYTVVQQNAYSWTSLMQGYIDSGKPQHAFNLYQRMQEDRIYPILQTFLVLLKACARLKCMERSLEVHNEIAKSGFERDPYVGNTLVGLYTKYGSVVEAREVFDELLVRDVVAWTALIAGYGEQGLGEEALNCLEQMQLEAVSPNAATFVCSLKACVSIGAVNKVWELHAQIAKQGFETDPPVGNTLVDSYAKIDSLVDAQAVFDQLLFQDVVSWTALIVGYTEHGLDEEALKCLEQMQLKGVFPDAVTFTCALKACGSIGAIDKGQELHTQIVKEGFEKGSSVGNALVGIYAKCGSFTEAKQVFNDLLVHDVISWTALISGFSEHGLNEETLICLEQLEREGKPLNAAAYVCSLKACASIRAIDKGRELHMHLVTKGFEQDSSVDNSLLDMYAKCGFLAEMQEMFDKLPVRSVVSWTALIAGYAEHGLNEEALNCLERMQLQGEFPDAVTYVCSLKACGTLEALHEGLIIHAEIVKEGFENGAFVGSSLVNMYTKYGLIAEAHEVFDELAVRDVVSWSALIAGYAEHGLGKEVLSCLEQMEVEGVSPNAVMFSCSLNACGSIGALSRGCQIHVEIVKDGYETDPVVNNTLVDMYTKCGALAEARKVFDALLVRDVVSWNSTIAGYAEHGLAEDALDCLEQMRLEGPSPNAVTYVCSLRACGSIEAIDRGREMHAEIAKAGFEKDDFVGNALVFVYAKCGLFGEAWEVFDKQMTQDVVSWNALIAGYVEHGFAEEALDCLKKMEMKGMRPNVITSVCSLKACSSIGATCTGKKIHNEIVKMGYEKDSFVGSTLVDMYAKCTLLKEARKVFDEMPLQDTILWTALIAGYARNGLDDKALQCLEQMQLDGLFPNVTSWNAMILGYAEQGLGEKAFSSYKRMQEQGLLPDSMTFVNILKACGNSAALKVGKIIHAQIHATEAMDLTITNVLTDMYGKCGSMTDAQQVFDAKPTKDLVRWTALIMGYARQGEIELAFCLFQRMRKEGIHPNGITFLSVLTVCSHAGLLHMGKHYFEIMTKGYGITPTIKHYNCMVDLLTRAGQLNAAMEMLEKMHLEPSFVTWSVLLGACRKWGNVELGRHVFDNIMRLDVKHAASYTLMHNIYADADMWEDAKKIEARRVHLQSSTKPRKSWIEIGQVVHTFMAGNTRHLQSEDSFSKPNLACVKTEERYLPGSGCMAQYLYSRAKEDAMCSHSEKLAFAHCILNTSKRMPIRVVTNYGICDDCHEIMARLSKVDQQTVICRDVSSLYVFKDGKCFCAHNYDISQVIAACALQAQKS